MTSFPEELNSVKIKGYRGKWHSISTELYGSHCLYLMEHDTYGDEVEGLIVDENLRLVLSDVWNGFEDFDEAICWYPENFPTPDDILEYLISNENPETES